MLKTKVEIRQIILWAAAIPFLLFSCSKDKEEPKDDYKIVKSDPQVSFRNPLWLSSLKENIQVDEAEPGAERESTVLGFLGADNLSFKKKNGEWLLKSRLQLMSSEGVEVWQHDLEAKAGDLRVSGEWTGLSNSDLRIFSICLHEDEDNQCAEVVIDIFKSHNGIRHAAQVVGSVSGSRRYTVESTTPVHAKMDFTESNQPIVFESTQQKTSNDQDEAEGVDPDEYYSVYVGHLFANLANIQAVKDQVIGLPNGGYMQNASSLKAVPGVVAGNIKYVHPSRSRHYGSIEMMDILSKLGEKSKAMSRAAPLWVGDISMKNGGRITNSGHKSHQSGIDVDVAYPMSTDYTGGFKSIFTNNGFLNSAFHTQETWELFKAAWALDVTDRIFVGSRVKKVFCNHSQKIGEKEAFSQLLRRLRPTPGHDNHFHLRIKCTPNQPRCRMMGPPPSGNGC